MLAVSGALDLKMGGPAFYLMDVVEENVMHYFAKEKFTPAEFRRMVYQFRIRQTTDSVFSSFDCPDGGQVMARRSRSNTPLQALNLFNSSFRPPAGRPPRRPSAQGSRRLAGSPGRPRLHPLLQPPAGRLGTRTVRRHDPRAEGLPSFCRALYNSSEFLFVF